LCLSTGGNSGSQAATLIIRALALGQFTQKAWLRVLRHGLFTGLALGRSLGVIAYVPRALRPEDIHPGGKGQEQPCSIRLPALHELTREGRKIDLPAETELIVKLDEVREVFLPRDTDITTNPRGEIAFPAKSEMRQKPVNRWDLAKVISFAVAGICLWGTLIGSMLPLVFRSIGVDPGIASSPFVATFVDVTGIMIYFSIARIFLL